MNDVQHIPRLIYILMDSLSNKAIYTPGRLIRQKEDATVVVWMQNFDHFVVLVERYQNQGTLSQHNTKSLYGLLDQLNISPDSERWSKHDWHLWSKHGDYLKKR